MTRIFTGDYSTGDFTQWDGLETVYGAGEGAVPGAHPLDHYSATVPIYDPDGGYLYRCEVRNGDTPAGISGGDRSEVKANTAGLAATGTTRWYAFSIKFDSSFPTNHSSLGWGIITQFKDAPGSAGGPAIHFGWPSPTYWPGRENGYWYLLATTQVSPPTVTSVTDLYRFPLTSGVWHDIKMRVLWKTDDTGTVKLWYNGEAATLLTGGTTFTGQTLAPVDGVTGAYPKQGYYRDAAMTNTGIVYHRGFRMASTEAGL